MNKIINLKVHRSLFVFFFITIAAQISYSQIGGKNIYQFLELSGSSRLEALGGVLVPINEPDINLIYQNPCLLDSALINHLGVSSVLFPGGINHGLVSYVRNTKRIGLIGFNLQYINYGRFQRADASGTKLGSFYGSEMAFAISWSGNFEMFRYGLNLKIISSFLEQYNSVGIAGDFYLMYVNRAEDFYMLGTIKNVGAQVKAYRPGNQESLPFDIQLSLGQRLEHVPITLIGTFHHLYKWDIRYDDPNEVNNNVFISDTSTKDNPYLFDKIMRHFVFGMELNLSENVDFRLGYNYLRRHELLMESSRSTIGFSWGVSFKIKKFKFDYARSKYHVAGTTNNISLTMNLTDLKKNNLVNE